MELIDCDCLLGLEIEIEGVNLRRSVLDAGKGKWWRSTNDGSLREGGREFIFNEPYDVKTTQLALQTLYEHIIRPPATVSMRTGIHVHLDIRDLSLEEFRRLCILYALLEEPIFAWMGDKREDNSFCMPWYKADGDMSAIRKVLSSNKNEFIKLAKHINRYAALNLNSVAKYGSLEFRHLQTTFDLDRVFTWINIILYMRQWAQKFEGGLWDILEHFSIQGPQKFLAEVFPTFPEELDANLINTGLLDAHDLISDTIQDDIEQLFYAHQLPEGSFKGWEKFMQANKQQEVEL